MRSGGTAHHGWEGVATRVEVSGHATHTARKEKEVEADVPVTHTARKQKEMKADVMFCLFFLLFSSGLPSMEWYYPHSEWILSPQLALSGNTLTHMPRGVSLG